MRFCGHVEVIAPEVGPVVEAEAAAGRVALRRRPFDMADLEGRDLVLAATDDAPLNAAIAEACRRRGIPVNASLRIYFHLLELLTRIEYRFVIV